MSKWALILGASTGHGGATAISLAEKGYGILGFHFDRGETKKEAEKTISKVSELNGGMCHYWNTNAASEETMEKYIPEICLLYTSPSPRDLSTSRMPSSA